MSFVADFIFFDENYPEVIPERDVLGYKYRLALKVVDGDANSVSHNTQARDPKLNSDRSVHRYQCQMN